MEILNRRHDVEIVRYERQFQYKADPFFSGCHSFPVDKDGNLLAETMHIKFDEIAGNPDYVDFGVKEIRYTGTEPAVGKCACGAKVYLDESFTGITECECGRWYFMDGTELEPSANDFLPYYRFCLLRRCFLSNSTSSVTILRSSSFNSL